MAGPNNAIRIRRELMVRLARLTLEDRLCEDVDRIPVEMKPRDDQATRCCVYKDRAVLKYRIMSLLGFGMEDEVDELTSLGGYAAEALARPATGSDNKPSPEPSVLDIACDSCTSGAHLVTDACRGCVARPCTTACPKDAITLQDGRARVDNQACVNCGLCVKECPFHAIIYRPVPCEQACPVDAITKDDRGRISIDREKCIACGRCLSACPFSAVMDRSQLVDVLTLLQGPERVVAAVAPAGIGQFSAPFEQLVTACEAIGFDSVYEVAAGADTVAELESRELEERLHGGAPFMTSSCCPSFVEAVRRHYSELVPYLSHTPSPMVVTGQRIRRTDPTARVVFVGPCLAKKREAAASGAIDYGLSFEELGAIFVAADVDVQECEPRPAAAVGGEAGRGFPIAGGVGRSVQNALADRRTVITALIDGLDSDGTRTLKRMARTPENSASRPEKADFVEVMACPGGCVGGPLAYGTARSARKEVEKQVRCRN